MPSNGTIAIGVLRNLDHHYHGQTFSCYAFAIQIAQAADVPGRFASTRTAPSWSCSCFSPDMAHLHHSCWYLSWVCVCGCVWMVRALPLHKRVCSVANILRKNNHQYIFKQLQSNGTNPIFTLTFTYFQGKLFAIYY